MLSLDDVHRTSSLPAGGKMDNPPPLPNNENPELNNEIAEEGQPPQPAPAPGISFNLSPGNECHVGIHIHFLVCTTSLIFHIYNAIINMCHHVLIIRFIKNF